MMDDEKEIALIKQLAEQATMKASAYAEGYAAGYERALELVKWKIENILKAKQNTDTQI